MRQQVKHIDHITRRVIELALMVSMERTMQDHVFGAGYQQWTIRQLHRALPDLLSIRLEAAGLGQERVMDIQVGAPGRMPVGGNSCIHSKK